MEVCQSTETLLWLNCTSHARPRKRRADSHLDPSAGPKAPGSRTPTTRVSLLAAQPGARPWPEEVASRKAIFTQVPGARCSDTSGVWEGWRLSQGHEALFEKKGLDWSPDDSPEDSWVQRKQAGGVGFLRTEVRHSHRNPSALRPLPPCEPGWETALGPAAHQELLTS